MWELVEDLKETRGEEKSDTISRLAENSRDRSVFLEMFLERKLVSPTRTAEQMLKICIAKDDILSDELSTNETSD